MYQFFQGLFPPAARLTIPEALMSGFTNPYFCTSPKEAFLCELWNGGEEPTSYPLQCAFIMVRLHSQQDAADSTIIIKSTSINC